MMNSHGHQLPNTVTARFVGQLQQRHARIIVNVRAARFNKFVRLHIILARMTAGPCTLRELPCGRQSDMYTHGEHCPLPWLEDATCDPLTQNLTPCACTCMRGDIQC